MRRRRHISIMALLVVILLLLSACLPVVNPPGKSVGEPRLEPERFITADGAVLPVRSWLPLGRPIMAVIVALHGFNDRNTAFSYTGAYLNRQDIACYAYDQRGFGAAPGHGLWSGSEAYTNDLTSFVRELRKRHPGIPLYALGESMGGAITIVAMTGSNPPPVDGVILVAPAVWARESMPWYQRWLLAVTSHTLPWLELTGKSLKIKPSDNIEMLRDLGRDPLIIKATRVDAMYGLTNLMDAALAQSARLQLPTLVLYGKNDQVIPKEPTLKMMDKMPETTRKLFYDDGYHMLLRDLQREKPMADIAAWITDHGKPLPYGRETWQ